MMQIRKSSLNDGTERSTLTVAFDTIDRCLNDLNPGQTGQIWGNSVLEVLHSHYRQHGLTGTLRAVVGTDPGYWISHAEGRTKLYARYRYKVSGFFQKSSPSTIQFDFGLGLERLSAASFVKRASWQQLQSYLLQRYISSRRVISSPEEEFSLFMNPVETYKTSGNLILRVGVSLSNSDLVQLWFHFNQQPSGKLLLVSDYKEIRGFPQQEINISREREYVDIEKLIDRTADHFDRRKDVVKSAFGIWSKSNDYIRGSNAIRKLTVFSADQFLAVVGAVEADSPPSDLAIFAQRPAPLRFKTVEGRIDILGERDLPPEEARIVGAARTCVGALDDLDGMLFGSNSLPSYRFKSGRIREIFNTILSGDYDDDIVVQLGTELLALDGRISKSLNEDDIAIEEAASFIILTKGFLAQFTIWNEYERNLPQEPIPEDALIVARELLESLNESVATTEAQKRITNYIEGVDSNPDEAREPDAGLVLTAENVVAQGAHKLASLAREQSVALSSEVAKAARKKSSDAIVQWTIAAGPKIARLATSTGSEWLRHLGQSLGL